MLDFEELFLDKVVIHKVGNKLRDESYHLSNQEDRIENENLRGILEKYFLRLFTNREEHHFYHDSDLNLNEVYCFSKKIFQDPNNFYEQSISIVKHLYNTSANVNIKSGDFYMALFVDNEQKKKALGIFKAENMDTFLKIESKLDFFSFSCEKGLNLNRIDKGCLILNEQYNEELQVFIIDSSSRKEKEIAKYWKENFLNVRRTQTDSVKTKEIIKLVNDFSKNILEKELDRSSKDIFKFKKEAANYLSLSDEYNESLFSERTFKDDQEKKVFLKYKNDYEKQNDLLPIENFSIDRDTFDRSKFKPRTTYKLDTGVDLSISSFDCVEEGYDEEKNMYYIKTFYNKKK
ncbi:nucleoid-associated protein [Enterococcus raffinosus]|uniref:nucleoid-associated protein n=1 Tax=Enterococcus raffinosus TaxID=71452 RepID=UPI001C128766|nr:nucleoid-associated protein [Enterococcus raffinosus]MBU5362745.1 nucleoid-associated protein [Enterococcus raffinosus]